MADNHEYVLGTHDEELTRLGLQHRLWGAQAFQTWERCGIQRGMTVLDVGAGPGFGSIDLAHLVGPGGRVLAVDESERYLEYLAARARDGGLAHVETRQADVQALDLPAAFDAAYARWVLCFTPNPEDVVRGVARALKTGARFGIHDYVNWQGLMLSPVSDAFERVMPSVRKSWELPGGDQAVGRRLPAMLAKNGFRVVSIAPIQRVARSTDPLWQWPTTFFGIFVPRLVEQGLVSPEDWSEMQRDWKQRSQDANAFFWTPPQVEIIAERV